MLAYVTDHPKTRRKSEILEVRIFIDYTLRVLEE